MVRFVGTPSSRRLCFCKQDGVADPSTTLYSLRRPWVPYTRFSKWESTNLTILSQLRTTLGAPPLDLRCGKTQPSTALSQLCTTLGAPHLDSEMWESATLTHPHFTQPSSPDNNRESGCHPKRSVPRRQVFVAGWGSRGICPKDSAKSFRFDSTGAVESLWSWVARRAMYDCGCLWRVRIPRNRSFWMTGHSPATSSQHNRHGEVHALVLTVVILRRGRRICRCLFAPVHIPANRRSRNSPECPARNSETCVVRHPSAVFVFVHQVV